MLYSSFLIILGVYFGQEYQLPRVLNVVQYLQQQFFQLQIQQQQNQPEYGFYNPFLKAVFDYHYPKTEVQ